MFTDDAPQDLPLTPPPGLVEQYRSWRWTEASRWPDQTTWRLDHPRLPSRYLKVVRSGGYPALAGEADRTRWARRWLPVAEVIDLGREEPIDWMVTTALPGRDATDAAWTEHEIVVRALAKALRRFHDAVPAARCPFDFRLHVAFDHVQRRARQGLIDPAKDFNDDHRYLDLPAALNQLDRLRPGDEDLVVCHGDYCPPNILMANQGAELEAVGYVDLGELGVADRWWDLAVATWSVTWNYGPGLEGLFLRTYGAEPDPLRQRFYRLLHDLAS